MFFLLQLTVFCEEVVVNHPDNLMLVTFPRTQAGYSNSSIETCSSGSRFNVNGETIKAIFFLFHICLQL